MNIVHLYPVATPLPDELVRRARRLQASLISDSQERVQGAVGIAPVGDCLMSLRGDSMVGTALTVRTRPGDNLAVHQALELARPGDVLVIDARGEVTNAILGELMTLYAASHGVAGIVVDGAVRDRSDLSEGPIPVFAKGISHMGPYKSGPGAIHGSVTIGGSVVHDGDLVVGDADGVVFVSRHRAESVITAAEEVVASEAKQREAISRGEWDRSWIDAAISLVPTENESHSA
ncbi:RraA family protein [Nesterenkonia sandarakina]|uniref:Putative 4-hydroxy-4-methyl-2-oxoglutarate aldolase n=1 Tax=Nesterenkonia sandarakina TaxID=272918 RepID=A0A2T0YAM6_9MICC|nr:RraA family protein [Nesterenkonia sandarakina]PRZ11755.1 regulator of RNase E activity RraA [Nesterenkonia sandarakina]